MRKRAITLDERKIIQLEMLKEVDTFCRANNIRYSLAYGTLLGAIRHKGFIPWDDDVDIMMPLPDMLKFKKKFHSDNLKYCDVDTEKHYDLAISRIAYKPTYRQLGLIFQSYGVSIDLYPIVSIPSDKSKQEKYFSTLIKLHRRRKFVKKWHSFFIKYLPLTSIPIYDFIQKQYRNYILGTSEYGSTGKYYIVAGPPEQIEIDTYNFDLFERLIDVVFEGCLFRAVKCYDEHLTKNYGNYMQLPPEENRHPYHIGKYYWKQRNN